MGMDGGDAQQPEEEVIMALIRKLPQGQISPARAKDKVSLNIKGGLNGKEESRGHTLL
jgi:hypothetical protein